MYLLKNPLHCCFHNDTFFKNKANYTVDITGVIWLRQKFCDILLLLRISSLKPGDTFPCISISIDTIGIAISILIMKR